MHYLLEDTEANHRTFSGIMKFRRGYINHVRTVKNMYNGDMWDRGYGYIGPLPEENNEEAGRIMTTLKRQYIPRNVIKEIIDRAVDALLGRSPDWKIYNKTKLVAKTVQDAQKRAELKKRLDAANGSIETLLNDPGNPAVEANKTDPKTPPTPDEPPPSTAPEEGDDNPEADEKEVQAELLLSEMWFKSELPKILREAVTDFMLTGEGRGRLYINKNYTRLENTDFDENRLLLEACKYIKAQSLEAGEVKLVDDDGEQLSIVKVYKKVGNRNLHNLEVSFVDDDNKTYIVVFKEADGSSSTPESTIDTAENEDTEDVIATIIQRLKENNPKADFSKPFSLDGRIIVGEMKGEPYLTTPMLQQNRALNLDLSLGVGVLVENGYAEMVTTNVDMDYEEVADPTAPGGKRRKFKNLKRGPTTTNNLVGLPSADQYGTVTYQQPGVHFKAPTPLTVFKEGADLYYAELLREAKQEFVLMNSDANISGESRIQARQDFVKKIQRYKPDVDKFMSWLLTTALHLAATIAGNDNYFEDYEVVADCKLSAGELTSDEKNTIITQYAAGLIGRESAMVLLGTEDPMLELEAIRVDEAEKLDLQVRRLVTARKYSDLLQADGEVNGTQDRNNPKDGKPINGGVSNRDKAQLK